MAFFRAWKLLWNLAKAPHRFSVNTLFQNHQMYHNLSKEKVFQISWQEVTNVISCHVLISFLSNSIWFSSTAPGNSRYRNEPPLCGQRKLRINIIHCAVGSGTRAAHHSHFCQLSNVVPVSSSISNGTRTHTQGVCTDLRFNHSIWFHYI